MCQRCVCNFRVLFVFISVCPASFFRNSLRDLCRRLHARSTSATKFVYFENRLNESSSRLRPDYCSFACNVEYYVLHGAPCSYQ